MIRHVDQPGRTAGQASSASPGRSDSPFLRTFVAYESVDSTSDRAADLVRKGSAPLPLAVWARRQNRGRGRGSHQWWSDPGSLTFTVAIAPAAHGLTGQDEPKLALIAALAVIDALAELGLLPPRTGIRWPNDVEVDGRKLGGILPEKIDTPSGHRALIGVGLNVLTNLPGAPDEVRDMATSLVALHAKPIDPELPQRLMSVVLAHFAILLGRLAARDFELPVRWNQLDTLRDQWLNIDQGGRVLSGRGDGIDADGALCLDDGRTRIRVFGGQVLRPTGVPGPIPM